MVFCVVFCGINVREVSVVVDVETREVSICGIWCCKKLPMGVRQYRSRTGENYCSDLDWRCLDLNGKDRRARDVLDRRDARSGSDRRVRDVLDRRGADW